eukprot:2100788-Rhodomonas_salina.1
MEKNKRTVSSLFSTLTVFHLAARQADYVCVQRTSLEGDRVEHAETFLDFDVGIWWKIKNSKFIVCKFAMDSEAPKKGVKVGDILRSVDGVDILNHKVDEEVSVQVISTL